MQSGLANSAEAIFLIIMSFRINEKVWNAIVLTGCWLKILIHLRWMNRRLHTENYYLSLQGDPVYVGGQGALTSYCAASLYLTNVAYIEASLSLLIMDALSSGDLLKISGRHSYHQMAIR